MIENQRIVTSRCAFSPLLVSKCSSTWASQVASEQDLRFVSGCQMRLPPRQARWHATIINPSIRLPSASHATRIACYPYRLLPASDAIRLCADGVNIWPPDK